MNWISVISTRIELYYNELFTGPATGFYYKHGDSTYLISNWHVFSGRNTYTGQPNHKHGCIPNNIRLSLLDKSLSKITHNIKINLYNENGNPLCFQHPDHGQDVDISFMDFSTISHDWGIVSYGNQQKHIDFVFSVGDDAVIVGYPKGIIVEGYLPLWKRAMIASEPQALVDGKKIILVDSATAEGLSGSPVYAVQPVGYSLDDGPIISLGGPYRRLIGVYSGRYDRENQFSAQIGRIWSIQYFDEMLQFRAPLSFEIR
jgi:hypothetical protein